ncbi:MAG: hypothetical protein ACI81R_002340 [Bradymonadia bacterium]
MTQSCPLELTLGPNAPARVFELVDVVVGDGSPNIVHGAHAIVRVEVLTSPDTLAGVQLHPFEVQLVARSPLGDAVLASQAIDLVAQTSPVVSLFAEVLVGRVGVRLAHRSGDTSAVTVRATAALHTGRAA